MNNTQIVLSASESPQSLVAFDQDTIKELASNTSRLDVHYRKDQEAIAKVRIYVPDLDKLEGKVREHYQTILSNSKLSEQVVMKTRNLKGDADAKFGSIQNAIYSIHTALLEYMKKAHQEKFNIAKYQPDLDKIQQNAESIFNFKNEAAECVASLDLVLQEDNLKHLGTEISDKELDQYLEASTVEKKKKEEYDAACEKVVSLSLELKQAQTTKEKSEEKVEDIQNAIELLRTSLEKNKQDIDQAEKQKILFAKQKEDAHKSADDSFSHTLEKSTKAKEDLEKGLNRLFNDQLQEKDVMISELTRKLVEVQTISAALHFIFVLDHSGSMQGPRWKAVEKSLDCFAERNKHQISDLLSIIVFSSDATEHLKKAKISEYTPPNGYAWGVTKFDPAFEMTKDIATLTRSHCPVVIFLTDGQGVKDRTYSILREMNARHRDQGFMLFSIGVGDDFDHRTLTEITKQGNNGNLYLDVGSERIAFLHTTKDEKVVCKIFDDIAQSVQSLPRKIKKAIEVLEDERNKLTKENKRRIESGSDLDNLSLKDFEEKQERLLKKRLATIQKTSADNEERIKFLEEKDRQLLKDISEREEEIIRQMNLSTNEKINDLEERLQQAKKAKEDVFKEYETALQERKKLFEQELKNKSERGLSTSQLFNFYNSRTEFKRVVDERRITLNNFKNFLGMIAEEAQDIEKHLKLTETKTQDLTDYGAFDIVVEDYCNINNLRFEPKQDMHNMQQIACYILRIKDTDKTRISKVQMLLSALHPRVLVSPDAKQEEQIGAIQIHMAKEYSDEKQKLEDEDDTLKNELETCEGKKEKLEEDISSWTKKIDKLDKELSTKEKEIRRLSKLQQKKLTKTEKQIQDQEDNNEDDDEDKLEDLMKEVQSMKKSKDELPKKIEGTERKIELLEKDLKETKQAIKFNKKKIDNLDRQSKKESDEIITYYSGLRAELLPRIKKYVNRLQIGELKVFHEKVHGRLISPLNDYFENSNNKMHVKKMPPLLQVTICGDP